MLAAGVLQARDQPFDAVVARLERVLAQHGALRLVVELQVDPVDRVVPLSLLRPLDERAPEAGSRGLRRSGHGGVDLAVAHGPLEMPASLEEVIERTRPGDVVVREESSATR